MAAPFIGLQMRVVLRDPVGYQVNGTVRDVEAGSSLTLTNGSVLPWSLVVAMLMQLLILHVLQSSSLARRTGRRR